MKAAAKVTKQVVASLVTGGVKKRKRAKSRPIFAYRHLYRDRLDPILKDLWENVGKKSGLKESDRLAYDNHNLEVMLEKEGPDILARVEEYREFELQQRNEADRQELEAECQELVTDSDMSAEEKLRLSTAKTRQMCAPISFFLSCGPLTSSQVQLNEHPASLPNSLARSMRTPV